MMLVTSGRTSRVESHAYVLLPQRGCLFAVGTRSTHVLVCNLQKSKCINHEEQLENQILALPKHYTCVLLFYSRVHFFSKPACTAKQNNAMSPGRNDGGELDGSAGPAGSVIGGLRCGRTDRQQL
jgi:hypothetical protein